MFKGFPAETFIVKKAVTKDDAKKEIFKFSFICIYTLDIVLFIAFFQPL